MTPTEVLGAVLGEREQRRGARGSGGGVLVLDIDKTITAPACNEDAACRAKNDDAVLHLLSEAEKRGMKAGIATARTGNSLHGVSESVQKKLRERMGEGMHCYRKKGASVEDAKVECLRKLGEMAGASKERTFFMDDRAENVEAARGEGYGSVQAPSTGIGIQMEHVELLLSMAGPQREESVRAG